MSLEVEASSLDFTTNKAEQSQAHWESDTRVVTQVISLGVARQTQVFSLEEHSCDYLSDESGWLLAEEDKELVSQVVLFDSIGRTRR
jgi:hypothetical protein